MKLTKNLKAKNTEAKLKAKFEKLSKEMADRCKFRLREKVWFMLDGLVPVEGIVMSIDINERYIILVRSPVYDYLTQFFQADKNSLFKTKEELEHKYLMRWMHS